MPEASPYIAVLVLNGTRRVLTSLSTYPNMRTLALESFEPLFVTFPDSVIDAYATRHDTGGMFLSRLGFCFGFSHYRITSTSFSLSKVERAACSFRDAIEFSGKS
jgi:hypothetical protein